MINRVYRPVRLPMYDWPELTAETQALEAALTDEICCALTIAPSKLLAWDIDSDLYDLWSDPGLLLAQTCGYPLTHDLMGKAAVVGAPHYDAEGCIGFMYCSQIVVPVNSSFQTLADLKGCRVVFNGPDSQSGMNALRHSVAPYAEAGSFFQSVAVSGSHLASMAAVAAGMADAAAIDAVCWTLAQRERPDLVRGLRCLAKTASAPCLPFVTSIEFSSDERAVIAEAVKRVFVSARSQKSRERLCIRGFSELDLDDYSVILDMEAQAKQAGYPVLA